MKPEHSITIKQPDLALDTACTYAIRVKGRLDSQRWAQWFDGMTITVWQGETIISGPVPDQAALYGMLSRLRDLALPLLSVERIAGGSGSVQPSRLLAYRWRSHGRMSWAFMLLYLLLAGGATALTVYVSFAGLLHTALALGLLFVALGGSAYGLLRLDPTWGWRLLVVLHGLAGSIALSIYVLAAGWLPVALGIALMLFGLAGLLAYLLYRVVGKAT